MNVIKKLTGYKQSLDKPELRPKAVLLDVNGTLFPAAAAAPAFKELGLDEGLIELWFARVLRDAFAAQAAGVFRPLKEVGAYHLEVMLRAAGKEEWSRLSGVDAMSKVAAAWAAAALYPDIPDALRHLNNANIKVSVLTNGSADGIANAVLGGNKVMQLVKGPLLDISMPEAWKPFSSSYQYAVKQLGVSAERVCMVASHPWDIAGAMQVRRGRHAGSSTVDGKQVINDWSRSCSSLRPNAAQEVARQCSSSAMVQD
ncbi:HAD-like domain-containing protein [Scenedesmus sp. NREL 46B-D3]|nr:HAD-like domain-containing protein [Scenedesmus sp. NREL 46B-D3]